VLQELVADRLADLHVGLADKIVGGCKPREIGTVSRSHTMTLAATMSHTLIAAGIRQPNCWLQPEFNLIQLDLDVGYGMQGNIEARCPSRGK
jgi:hypothetical protein